VEDAALVGETAAVNAVVTRVHGGLIGASLLFWLRLHELDPVTKWVVCVTAIEPLKRLILDDLIAVAGDSGDQRWKVRDNESGVRLPGGLEVSFDPQMNLERAVFEPTSAASCEVRRLRHFGDTERFLVKGARQIFASARHCQLHMVEAFNSHMTALPGEEANFDRLRRRAEQ
jgi:hypothetical protein